MTELWTVQRPATIWLTVKVKAETLEEALELADTEFSNGEYKEDEDSFSIDDLRYWAMDEYKNVFFEDKEQATNVKRK
jgi:hypothetical protein